MIGTETSTVSSSTGSASSLPSRTEFHKDDYTHPFHPLYVHPSDILGGSLVYVPFDGTCYASWRRTILVTVSVRNKLEFIDGTSLRPSSDSPLARQWQRCNDLVLSWLLHSLSKEIGRSVEYSELASDAWSELEERYGKADDARIFELRKELAHISQGSLDIPSYFNKIKQHCDAALCGLMTPFINDMICFKKPIGSVTISGHKFLGCPMPCGVQITRKRYINNLSTNVEYIAFVDATISGSRNGLTPIFL